MRLHSPWLLQKNCVSTASSNRVFKKNTGSPQFFTQTVFTAPAQTPCQSTAQRALIGRTAFCVAAEDRAPSTRFKRKPDKLELLSDAEPIDYSSVARNENRLSDSATWHSTSNRTTYQKSRANVSTRPPKNLFDDVWNGRGGRWWGQIGVRLHVAPSIDWGHVGPTVVCYGFF